MRPRVICSVIAGKFTDHQLREMQAEIAGVYQEQVPRILSPRIIWAETKPENLFTEGKPSSSSVILAEVPDQFDQTRRELLLAEICTVFTRTGQVAPEQIVVTVADSSYADLYLKCSRQRIRATSVPATGLFIARNLAGNYVRRKLLTVNTSLGKS